MDLNIKQTYGQRQLSFYFFIQAPRQVNQYDLFWRHPLEYIIKIFEQFLIISEGFKQPDLTKHREFEYNCEINNVLLLQI